jgi:hypothetical protein
MIQKHIDDRMVFPTKNDVVGATFSLMILALTYRFHPIDLVGGKLGCQKTNARLTFDDVQHVVKECIRSKHSLFDSGMIETMEETDYATLKEATHYAIAIEWLEAAEMYFSYFKILFVLE